MRNGYFKNKYNKAVTFSYDDGVTQDKRLIELFDKYNLKATFNLNSELLGLHGELIREGVKVSHIKNNPYHNFIFSSLVITELPLLPIKEIPQ